MPRLKRKSDLQNNTSMKTNKKKKRLDEEYKRNEKIAKQVKRLDEEYKRNEKIAKQVKRLDEEYKRNEKIAKQVKRLDEEYKRNEKIAKQVKRLDEEYKRNEKIAKQVKRLDEEYKKKEKIAKQVKRLDEDYKKKERIAMQARRLIDVYRKDENAKNKERIVAYRLDNDFRKKEQLKKNCKELDSLLEQYHSSVAEGPTLICSCCGGLWYKKSARAISRACLLDIGKEFVQSILNYDQGNSNTFCWTCWNAMTAKTPKIPKLSLSNGFHFPVVPPVITDLTALEERLVALRLPFYQIRTLGSDRQCGLKGSVVNVINDLDLVAKSLPRSFNDSSVVQVMLMRRLCYKSPYMYEPVRPLKVYEAARYLSSTELYKAEGVCLSNEWATCLPNETVSFITKEDEDEENCTRNDNASDDESDVSIMECEDDSKDDPTTTEEQIEQETMVMQEDGLSNQILRLAPGEGKRPLSLLRDLDAEVLSFPKIYAGVKRKFKDGLKITITDIAKSEARRYDRRCCQPAKLLWSYKLCQTWRIADAIQLCLRKKKGCQNITAGQLKDPSFVSTLVQHDDGYRMLKGIRGSPAYWENYQKNVMAMLRQLGTPTLFMTFSAAETKWTELLINLSKILNGVELTVEEAENLSFREKSELIRNDPITCARNFDHRIRLFLNLLLKSSGGIFSEYNLIDYFLRDEFQQRGSPHCHGLYWLKNAPIYKEGTEESAVACAEFIDKYISCERKETAGMDRVIAYQIHKHSHTCKKKVKTGTICRFGFPIPPMDSTTILLPLEEFLDKDIVKSAKETFLSIKTELNQIGRDFQDSVKFADFLGQLRLTKEEYLMAVRSSIKRPTVFLKRSVNAIFVNPYNETMLKAWRANMDIQFILDPFSCARYCVSYLAKDDRGVSKLLRTVNEECRKGNVSVKDKLRRFANTFTNFVEISAQEAAYGVLSIPLVRCSVATEFINTSPPEERVFLVKPLDVIANLPDECKEIATEGVLARYATRPAELDDVCLADFVALFTFSKSKFGSGSASKEELNDDADLPESEEGICVPIKCDNGWLKRRIRPKVIRYRRYGEQKDKDNFFREQIMLFLPWRDEQREVLGVNRLATYLRNKQLIEAKRSEYDKNGISENIEDYIKENEEDDEEDVAIDSEHLIMFDKDTATDIFQDMGLVDQNARFDYIKAAQLIPDDEYRSLIRSLNMKQRKYFMHIVHKLKMAELPFYELVHGGAGVGKSHLIFAIVQTITRMQSRIPGRDLNNIAVLVAAFTGKAACNVFGITLHSAFRLPNTQYSGDIVQLVDDVCNTLRAKLIGLKLIVIDEISMVSVKQLYQIDARLRQVFQTNAPFGGVSILTVGHFRQLKPVMASYIFEVPRFTKMGDVTGNTLWPLYRFYELEEIMRQKGELEFCIALNNMSEGTMTEEDIALIRAREISNELVPPDDAVRLFYTNAECQDYNTIYHSKLKTESAVSIAIDRIQGSATDSQKVKLLEQARNFKTGDSDGLPYEVHLQVEADYYVSTNIDVSDGLFNGCTGTLKKIEYGTTSDGHRIPIRAWMKFINTFSGANARGRTKEYQLSHGIDETWTSINLETRALSRTQRHKHQIIRKQLPLVAANATSIHKSQSSTMESLVVSMKKKLTRELIYTACSRAKTYSGLYLDGEFQVPRLPSADDPVTLEMARLRENPVRLSLNFLQDLDDSSYKLIFHNVQSLHKHFEDIICDPCYTSADVMAFVEPWTLPKDDIGIEGFSIVSRQDCSQTRNSEGSLVYAKTDVFSATGVADNICRKTQSGHHILTIWTFNGIRCILVYRSPSSCLTTFYKDFENQLLTLTGSNTIITGDFNIDLNGSEGQILMELLNKYGLESKLPTHCSTTDGGSQIDACFSDVDGLQAWIYESVFSYHKPICISWPKDVQNRTAVPTIAPSSITHTHKSSSGKEANNSSVNDLTQDIRDMTILPKLSLLLQFSIRTLKKISAFHGTKNITGLRNYFLNHSQKMEEIFLVLSSSNIFTYDQQNQDLRSRRLLPTAFLECYVPVLTPAEGNCFYAAVAINLLGDSKYHPIIRLAIVCDVVLHEQFYTQFMLSSHASYSSYKDFVMSNMRDGDWADTSIMYAASKVCKRPIHSYSMDFGAVGDIRNAVELYERMGNPIPGVTRHHRILFCQEDSHKRPICFHYRNMLDGGEANHFVALLARKVSSIVFPCLLHVFRTLRNFGV